jgi:hypothetical protein
MSLLNLAGLPFNVVKLARLGLLDPRSNMTDKTISNAQARYDALIKEPWYQDYVERLQQGGFENSITEAQLPDRPVIMPEDLAGNALVSYKTDRSNVGKINKISGLDVDVDAQGGGKFTLTDPRFGWMSMGGEGKKMGIAERAHRNAQLISDLTGRPVTATNNLMGPDSSFFSTPVAELMYNLIQEGKVPKGLLDTLDQQILKNQGKTARKENPFVGIRSQEALEQLKGQGDHSMYGAGALRHAFLKSISQPAMRDSGLPQPRTALAVYDDPMYEGLPTGTTGFNMWTPDVNKDVVDAFGTHDSYSTGFPKQVDEIHGARYPVEISWEAQNPKLVRELEGAMTESKYDKKKDKWSTPRLMTRNEKMNATMDRTAALDNATIQTMDQEAIDSASKAIEHNLRLKKEYGSIPVALAAGEVFADPVSDLRTAEAQFNMSPEERAIDDLRASEREFGNYDKGLADAYSGASTLWNNVGTSLKNVGVPAGLVDLMQPTYESSAAKAEGDDSAMTGLFAMLEKLDPVAYAGLLGSEYLKRNK